MHKPIPESLPLPEKNDSIEVSSVDHGGMLGLENSKWIKKIDVNTLELEKRLVEYDHKIHIFSQDKLKKYTIVFTKALFDNNEPVCSMVLTTQYGPIEIDNGQSFLQLLTGIPIPHDMKNQYRILNLSQCFLPTEMQKWLSLSTPSVENIAAQEVFKMTLTIYDGYSSFNYLVRSNSKTWLSLLDDPSIEKNQNAKFSENEKTIEIDIKIGSILISKRSALKLKEGCIVKPDQISVDENGNGYICLGEKQIPVSLIEIKSGYFFKVNNDQPKNQEKGHKKMDTTTDNIQEGHCEQQAQNTTAEDDISENLTPNDILAENIFSKTPPEAEINKALNGQVNKQSIDNCIGLSPIKIDLVLGVLETNSRELDKIKPSDVLQVKPLYEKQISLQINGCEIGNGELVCVNNELRIQICNLWFK